MSGTPWPTAPGEPVTPPPAPVPTAAPPSGTSSVLPPASAPPPSSPATTTLVSTLEAVPGSILAWATKPGQKTTEGLATILAVPITAVLSFLLTFLVAYNLVGSGQTTMIISTVVPGLASAAASYAVRGYAAGRAALKAEAIRLHLPPV